jgi:quercetin dioxygenase-like cupin family protein
VIEGEIMTAFATQRIQFAPGAKDEDAIWYFGNLMKFHADRKTTSGHYALVEVYGRPGFEPPRHIHENEDELFYVLEGRLTAFRGDEEIELGPGQSAFLPRKVPHTFRIDTPVARGLILITPAGFEDYFREMGRPAETVDLPSSVEQVDVQRVVHVAGKYGVRFMPNEVVE